MIAEEPGGSCQRFDGLGKTFTDPHCHRVCLIFGVDTLKVSLIAAAGGSLKAPPHRCRRNFTRSGAAGPPQELDPGAGADCHFVASSSLKCDIDASAEPLMS